MLSSTLPAAQQATRRGHGWLAPLAIFLAACLLYSIKLERLPDADELYHILAAQGMLATGEPRLADGLYTRVLLHTWLVAQSFRLFGESLTAARLPSVLFMAALLPVLFLWLRREAGNGAAWLATTLFGLSPFAVSIAEFCRFYALQSLVFLVTVLSTQAALTAGGGLPRRLAALAVALPAALLGVYLQPTTALGLIGLCAWGAGALLLPWLARPDVPRARKWALVGLLAGAGLALLAVGWASGLLARAWHDYREVPLFRLEQSDQFWFYHAWYSLFYPTLWPLTGILSLVAVVTCPRPALLALVVFAVSFLLNSFAGMKNLRYLVYAQPFLFALWGIALAALAPRLTVALADLGDKLGALLPHPARHARRLAQALVGGALLFLVLANPAWLRTATLLADVAFPPEVPETNWPAARDSLLPWLQRADVVVTAEELGALYFLGRFDVTFSRSKLHELADGKLPELARDPRTGRPIISTAGSLTLLMDCYRSGLMLVPTAKWNQYWMIDHALSNLIAQRMQPLEVPAEARLFAYTWDRVARGPRPAACAELDALGLGRLSPQG